MERFDAIVIGTGQAGPSLAARLSAEGRTVAVLERGRVGGSCVNYGCTPTKALVASARAIHVARRGDDFGFEVDGEIRVDMARVKARMRKIAGESNRGVTAWLEGLDGVELIRGHSRLEGPGTVRVGQRRLEADAIFLNVGTRARRPEMPGSDDVRSHDQPGAARAGRAAAAPRRRGRRLRRPRARPGVPALRQPGHDRREEPARPEARGPGRLRGDRRGLPARRDRRPAGVRLHRLRAGGRRDRGAALVRRRAPAGGRLPRTAGRRPGPEHRRAGTRRSGGRDRREGPRPRRRPAPHLGRGDLGPGRLQRRGRLHPHRLQRLRDRRRQPVRRRPASRLRPDPDHSERAGLSPPRTHPAGRSHRLRRRQPPGPGPHASPRSPETEGNPR